MTSWLFSDMGVFSLPKLYGLCEPDIQRLHNTVSSQSQLTSSYTFTPTKYHNHHNKYWSLLFYKKGLLKYIELILWKMFYSGFMDDYWRLPSFSWGKFCFLKSFKGFWRFSWLHSAQSLRKLVVVDETLKMWLNHTPETFTTASADVDGISNLQKNWLNANICSPFGTCEIV